MTGAVAPAEPTADFAKLPAEEAAAALGTPLDRGLSREECARRLQRYGYNEIKEREEPLWRLLARRFWGPIPWMIETAAVLSAIVRRWEDFVIVLVLLLVNAGIDFHQEVSARGALRILKKKLARLALVLREGAWREIEAREIVPGDLVKLRIGAIVPADVKLVGGAFLQVDQSALTGESLPADKGPGDIVFGNSIVRAGEMTALVTATGARSYYGKTVALVARAEMEQTSHFQKAVIEVGDYLIKIALAMVVLIVAVALWRKDPMMEIFRFALVLSVASIPVALPAVLSVTMAAGAVRLAKLQAIVTRLVSIEELAGVDVLCSDKTGTLTKNQMALGPPSPAASFTAGDLLFYAGLASREENNDPLEAPIFGALKKSGGYAKLKGLSQKSYLPFDPVRKRTEASIGAPGGDFTVTKGAPQAVLALCADDAPSREAEAKVQKFAAKGYRALGVAVKRNGEPSFRFAGLLPFYDPPRDDSKQTIARTKELGLKVKMLTGDNSAIASQIAGELGIEGPIWSAAMLGKSGAQLERLIVEAGGVAQVFPEDKYRIVEALQRADHIVAMTGDGVNDAPALKKADAGIAVSGSTDAARAAADVVLLAPGLSVIVKAVEEARMIFGRMKSYSVFRISETMRVILFMTLAITVFNFYPVTATMIIILALLNDIPIMAIAYDNAKVEPRPVRWNMTEVLGVGTALGLAGVASSFLLFFILEKMGLPAELIRSILFLKLDVAGHSTIYVARTGGWHFWRRPYPSPKMLIPALGTRIAGTLIAVYGFFMAPVGWKIAGYVYLYATAWMLFNDYLKVGVYKTLRSLGRLGPASS